MAPSLDGGFLNWDDDRFIVDNPHVQGFSLENLTFAFGALRFESYQPLHLVSYMIDGALWPARPLGYRAHSLALYLGGVLLLYGLQRRAGIKPLAASVGTLVFAVAPYRVESVAWIAGRKDVLMLVFALAAWHLHLKADERPGPGLGWRGLALLGFVAALLSKSSALVLPVMMVVLDVGLLGKPLKRSILVLTPFLLLALALALGLPLVWSEAELTRETIAPGVEGRATLVGWTIGHYVDTLLWPFRLSPLYAQPSPAMLSQGMALGLGAILALAALLGVTRLRKRPVTKPLVVILLFFTALAPFSNLIPLYYLVADRYLLLPSIGLALGAGLLIDDAKGARKRLIIGLGVVVIAVYGLAAASEGRAWRTSESLWRHAVARQPGAFYARIKLGETLRNGGKPAESAEAYRKALAIRPLSPVALGGVFWGELLQDAAEVPGISDDETEKLAFKFVAMANDGKKLLTFAEYLKRRGCERAAKVVMDRVYPPSVGARRASP
jgi:hypothetical protein